MNANAIVLTAALLSGISSNEGESARPRAADASQDVGDSAAPTSRGGEDAAARDAHRSVSAKSAGGAVGERRTGHIQDDYADALERARRLRVPIVVDVWAPW